MSSDSNLFKHILDQQRCKTSNRFIYLVLFQIEEIIFTSLWQDWKNKFYKKTFIAQYPEYFLGCKTKESVAAELKKHTDEFKKYCQDCEDVVTARNQLLDLYLNVSSYLLHLFPTNRDSVWLSCTARSYLDQERQSC